MPSPLSAGEEGPWRVFPPTRFAPQTSRRSRGSTSMTMSSRWIPSWKREAGLRTTTSCGLPRPRI
eukprot:16439887-Heterocapsa_arctica.AAC.1